MPSQLRTNQFATLLIAGLCLLGTHDGPAMAHQACAEDKTLEEDAPCAQTGEPMNNTRLGAIIRRLDPDAEGQPGRWRFSFDGHTVLVITDPRADRMRVMVPIASFPEEDADPTLMYQLLQANFDTALDARYAIAQGSLWSTFIHPLSPLDNRQFLSGVAQAINLAATFGTSFSSGALRFGGGDSNADDDETPEDRHDRLLEKGEAL